MNNLLCHWAKYHRQKKWTPISHEKNTNLGKIFITRIYFMVKFDEKLSWVILYVNNAPSQAVKPLKTVLKKISTKTTNTTKNISSNTRVQFWKNKYCKNKIKIALPAQYFIYFPDKRTEVIYILVPFKLHIGNDMDTGHHVCDILD